MGKSAIKNPDTYKDRNIETEQVWLDQPGKKLRNFELFTAFLRQVKSNSLSFYLSVFECMGVLKNRFSQL